MEKLGTYDSNFDGKRKSDTCCSIIIDSCDIKTNLDNLKFETDKNKEEIRKIWLKGKIKKFVVFFFLVIAAIVSVPDLMLLSKEPQ